MDRRFRLPAAALLLAPGAPATARDAETEADTAEAVAAESPKKPASKKAKGAKRKPAPQPAGPDARGHGRPAGWGPEGNVWEAGDAEPEEQRPLALPVQTGEEE